MVAGKIGAANKRNCKHTCRHYATEHDECDSERVRADSLQLGNLIRWNRDRVLALDAVGLHSRFTDRPTLPVDCRDSDLSVVRNLTAFNLRVRVAASQPQKQPDQGQRDGAVTENGSPPVLED